MVGLDASEMRTPANPRTMTLLAISPGGLDINGTTNGKSGISELSDTWTRSSNERINQTDPKADGLMSSPGQSPAIAGLSIERLRLWRHDALLQHQYETAEFIGDKIYTLTDDPNDAFWLAQAYFLTGAYSRALDILKSQDLLDTSLACRYLGALCRTKQSKWTAALEILGDDEYGSNGGNEHVKVADDGGISLDSSIAYLRGYIYAQQNNFDKARVFYKQSLQIDVKCFEALDQLLSNSLLSPDEEWDLLSGLDFSFLSSNDREFVYNVYLLKLSKYGRETSTVKDAIKNLSEKFGLGKNLDLKLTQAEQFFTRCYFKECVEISQDILHQDQFRLSVYPVYLASLYELKDINKLFYISHNLAENYPESSITWLAVAIYYLSIGRIAEARRYFSKSSVKDPHFGPAWIGFAHSFALEGEHDQAIAAYSTASRLFQG